MEAKVKNIERWDFKLETIELKIDTLDAITNKIDRLDVKLEITEENMNNTDRLDAKLETIEAKIQSLKDSFGDQFAGSKKEMGQMMIGIAILNDSIEKDFSVIKGNVQNSWQQLQLNTEESASKTLNAFQSVAKKLNNTIFGKVKSAYTELFSPRRCKKNGPLVPFFSSQYTVINRSEIPGLDIPILCDTITDGGGWIVIQRRYTREVDFYRNWTSYKVGFGSLDNDFWLGNDNIHSITSTGEYELRVEIRYKGLAKFANYGMFSLDGEEKKYTLHVGSYSGTAGDSLKTHNGQKFSTFDQDNDIHQRKNCAEDNHGAWWYYNCQRSNLNGMWDGYFLKGIRWDTTTFLYSAEFSEMKIRRVNE
ncbi:hypothetical protein EGW08_014715 [Elysia chlorotica]|uniref:Fibrinogen C-terminal domain-containing protein n=1 Tax=Elysia chlorotica TaxID=188477 RepID=A0A3S1HE68_ELYCH|nr:hypothetical protein EGW08_014715 [Elysia chlorotica]